MLLEMWTYLASRSSKDFLSVILMALAVLLIVLSPTLGAAALPNLTHFIVLAYYQRGGILADITANVVAVMAAEYGTHIAGLVEITRIYVQISTLVSAMVFVFAAPFITSSKFKEVGRGLLIFLIGVWVVAVYVVYFDQLLTLVPATGRLRWIDPYGFGIYMLLAINVALVTAILAIILVARRCHSRG